MTTIARPEPLAVLSINPTEVYVSPIDWYGGNGPETVTLIGTVIYPDLTTSSIVLDHGTTYILGPEYETVDTISMVNGWRGIW